MEHGRKALPALLCGLVLAAPSTAAAERTWVAKGHGWGHGVGMSQYGAYGMARHGSGYREILGHYYRGTKIGRKEGSVRVLVADNVGSFSFSGATRACGEELKGSAQYSFAPAGSDVLLRSRTGDKLANCGPVGAAAGGKSVDYAGVGSYRGSLVGRADAGSLDAVNKVGIEGYVKGVVANEMPSSWDAEALKVQAVAARSYALATRLGADGFDLYDDTRSQVYGGKASETEATNHAVQETAGEVLLYNGKVATTYFSSTSGGMTENSEFGFGGQAIPYLKGVRDPYDDISPEHNWKETYSQSQLEAELGSLCSGNLQAIKVVKTGVSPRIVKARVICSDGTQSVTGFELQGALGLKSTWVRFAER